MENKYILKINSDENNIDKIEEILNKIYLKKMKI
jgi:hypothetical protein